MTQPETLENRKYPVSVISMRCQWKWKKKMISENWGVLKGFCRFHVIYESFGEQNTGSQCLKRNLIQNISMDKSVILLFLMLSLTLLHFFSLTPLSFAHLRSHTDIYFYREALPSTHSPVRSTCLMFILLLNHQSISIGC